MAKTTLSYKWSDRKRIIFGLPWTFTKYAATDEKLLIRTGVLNVKEDEVRLYRILDLTLKRTLFQRLWGLGTIHVCSADKSTPEFEILNIKNPEIVKNMLSDMVEEERRKKRVSGREFMSSEEDEIY
ncbi:MAG: PH domain-containing protein [Candidatus Gastranaerophilaceae bacterium]